MAVNTLLTLAAVATVVIWIRSAAERRREEAASRGRLHGCYSRPVPRAELAKAIQEFYAYITARITSGHPEFVAEGHSFTLNWYRRGASRNQLFTFGPFAWRSTIDFEFPAVPRHTYYELTLPFWFPTFAFASYPVLSIARGPLRRWRRRRRRQCLTCGYNLTGNTSGRCPECGRSITSMAKHLRPTDRRSRSLHLEMARSSNYTAARRANRDRREDTS